jgi:hypothetical protein
MTRKPSRSSRGSTLTQVGKSGKPPIVVEWIILTFHAPIRARSLRDAPFLVVCEETGTQWTLEATDVMVRRMRDRNTVGFWGGISPDGQIMVTEFEALEETDGKT